MKLFSIAALLHLQIFLCGAFIYANPSIPGETYEGDLGKPLILTPLIQQGKIEQARTAAKVTLEGMESTESYAAFLTVDDLYDSNMFFWFFPSQTDYANDPVLLWLDGGPGSTSLIGLFIENGPFMVEDQILKPRKISWTQNHSVLYIDNPLGTGFSFTSGEGYSKNETVIGANLYKALLQFFQLFPELQKNDFFVAGVSYAGKYVPAVSYMIHKNNPSSKQKINLQGMAVGNGLSDPEHQLGYGEYLYQIGLIDTNKKELIEKYENQAIEYIKNKQWVEAFKLMGEAIYGGINNYPSLFHNVTGFDNYYNYLITGNMSKIFEPFEQFIQKTKTRRAIHVGDTVFHVSSKEAKVNLISDIMQSVAPWLSELLSHYRILIYNGQLDIIVAYPLTANYLKNLNFSAAHQYKTATRHQWYVNDSLAGYVKQAGNLTEILVRNAGHIVSFDQPQWAFDMISRFTRNQMFYH